MKQLIIYADPNPNSFCRAIADTLCETLTAAGKDVFIRDLYEMKFDSTFSLADMQIMTKNDYMADVKEEQELIQDASVITFVYPIWWLGPPAILKGYFDRVFAEDFAYSYGAEGFEKGLVGKKAAVINTMGAKTDSYEKKGMIDAMKKITDKGILEYTGMEVVEHIFFGEISTVSDEVREEYLQEVRGLGEKLATIGILKESDAW